MNEHWVRIAACEDIPPREGRAVAIAGRQIAIFNLGDRFLATDNSCPHKGGPLCEGIVSGTAVVCPLHAWKIDLETGAVLRPRSETCIQSYPVRVEEGIVSIAMCGTKGQAA